jgi:two-component system sensor histidine kinase/response regulator
VSLIEQTQFQALCDLAAGDNEFIVSVIDAFLPQLQKIPGELHQALVAGDSDTLKKVAHSLKGSAGNVGAEDVSQLCRQIEEAGQDGNPEAATPFVYELVTVAKNTYDAYAAEKARLG